MNKIRPTLGPNVAAIICEIWRNTQIKYFHILDLLAVDDSKNSHEDPNRIYETINEVGYEVSLIPDTYSYPGTTISRNPKSPEFEFSHAKDTDFPRLSAGAREPAERPADNGAECQTSEQPDTTTIKIPSSELEYTYANDTELPRVTVATVATDPANNAIYHILEQPEQSTEGESCNNPDTTIITKPTSSSELECTDAKDAKATAKESVNDAFYHTLEQLEQSTEGESCNYPDTTTTAKSPSSSELECTDAKNTKATSKESVNDAVYHTLEQLEQSTEGESCNYPDTTTIAKPSTSGLDCTDPKDTDIPKATTNATTVPEELVSNAVYRTLEHEKPPTKDLYNYAGTNIPMNELESTHAKDADAATSIESEKSAADEDGVSATSNALYHTLEQEGSAPSEQENINSKNTDSPLILPPHKEQTSDGQPSPSPNAELYHTQEEPCLPKAPVYTTLEGPENRENPQVIKKIFKD